MVSSFLRPGIRDVLHARKVIAVSRAFSPRQSLLSDGSYYDQERYSVYLLIIIFTVFMPYIEFSQQIQTCVLSST